MTQEEIEAVASEVSKNVFHPILRSMISRTEAAEAGKELYKTGYGKAVEHMQPKIAELEGGISMAITIMEHAIALECFTPNGSTERMVKDWISKYKDKIREGENGKAE